MHNTLYIVSFDNIIFHEFDFLILYFDFDWELFHDAH